MNTKPENVVDRNDERPFKLQLQDEIDYVTLGRHMRETRKALNYTQTQISEILGLKPNYYGQYETGTRHINVGLNIVKASTVRRWPVIKAFCLCGDHPFDGWLSLCNNN